MIQPEVQLHKRNNADILIEMICKLVDIIKYENQYAFELLCKVTSGKHTTIDIDNCKVYLKARKDDDYILVAKEKGKANTEFICSSLTLKKIMNGMITIDGAIAQNEINIKGSFKELNEVYQLMITLLTEGPLNHRLRELWEDFNENWNCQEPSLSLQPLEKQKPVFDYLITPK